MAETAYAYGVSSAAVRRTFKSFGVPCDAEDGKQECTVGQVLRKHITAIGAQLATCVAVNGLAKTKRP